MANYILKFCCDSEDGSTIETERNQENQIYISINSGDKKMDVVLDKSTAIKFAKTLRTEINKIQ